MKRELFILIKGCFHVKKIFLIVSTLLVFLFISTIFIISQNEQLQKITYKAMIGQHQIPKEYIPIYKEAAEQYSIPWELLASIHRVETIFSTMDPLVSSAGALGHFQFMPRTWVGWTHPGGSLGQLDESVDITDVELIEEHQGYGIDVKGKGKADPFDLYDATFAAAKYLADHGASSGNIEDAVFAYNRSDEYVKEVMKYYYSYKDYYEPISLHFKKADVNNKVEPNG